MGKKYYDFFMIDEVLQKYVNDATYLWMVKEFSQMQGVDVVEVVRCKDCKHFYCGIDDVEYWMECGELGIALSSDDWFCADGERRSE